MDAASGEASGALWISLVVYDEAADIASVLLDNLSVEALCRVAPVA